MSWDPYDSPTATADNARFAVLYHAGKLSVRGNYDKQFVRSIVNSALFVNVGFVDEEGLPQILPMNGHIEEDEHGEYVLLHGAYLPLSRVYRACPG